MVSSQKEWSRLTLMTRKAGMDLVDYATERSDNAWDTEDRLEGYSGLTMLARYEDSSNPHT